MSPLAVARVVVVALLATGCGFPTQDAAVPLDESNDVVVATSLEPLRGPAETVTLWFVKDGALVPTRRRVPSPAEVQAVLSVMLQGVSSADADKGIRSAIPSPTVIDGVDVSGGTATVSLTTGFLDIPVADQSLAVAQVVVTLTDLRGVGQVRFTVDGSTVLVPLPDGSSTDDSVSRDDFVVFIAR